MGVPRLDQKLLARLAAKRGKSLTDTRKYVSKVADREGTSSEVALINAAREEGLGTAHAVRRLGATLLPELGRARVFSEPKRQRAAGDVKKKAAPKGSKWAGSSRKTVFVSHSSKDLRIIRCVVDLIRSAFNLPADQIVCTSLNGFRLMAGEITDDALRGGIAGAAAFVGVITRSSADSAYVLFECGARWGAGKRIVPLLAAGFRANSLPGPLVRMNALNLNAKGEILQFVSDLGTILEMEPERPAVYEAAVSLLHAASRSGRAEVSVRAS